MAKFAIVHIKFLRMQLNNWESEQFEKFLDPLIQVQSRDHLAASTRA